MRRWVWLFAVVALACLPSSAAAEDGVLDDGTWTYRGTATHGTTVETASLRVVCQKGRCEALDVRGWTGSPETFPVLAVVDGQLALQVPEDVTQPCARRQLDNTITGTFTARDARVTTQLAASPECGAQAQRWRFVGTFASFDPPPGFGASAQSVLSALPKAGDVSAQGVATAGGAAVVVGSLMVFPAALLNDAVDEMFKRLAARRRRARGAAKKAEVRWWHAALGVIAAGVLSGFVDPHFGLNLGSVRVGAALVLSFVLEVVVGWSVVSWLVRRATPLAKPTYSFQPFSLLIVAALVVFTRVTGFEPGIVFGLVAGVGYGERLGRAATGKVALVGLAHAYVLAIGAWIGYSLLDDRDDVFGLFVADSLSALTVGGVAALPLALLPIEGMAGKKVFDWSRQVWGTSYLLGLFGFFVIVMPMPSSWSGVDLSLGIWLAGYAVYLGVAVAAWLFVHRDPKRRAADKTRSAS